MSLFLIGILLLVAAFAGGLLFLKFGDWRLLVGVMALLILGVGSISYDIIDVTDEESVTYMLRELATTVHNNDLDGTLGHFSTNHREAYDEAAREMPNYDFQVLSLREVQSVEIIATTPRTARVKFLVWFVVDSKLHGYGGAGSRIVELSLVEEEKQVWKVTGYEHYEPR